MTPMRVRSYSKATKVTNNRFRCERALKLMLLNGVN